MAHRARFHHRAYFARRVIPKKQGPKGEKRRRGKVNEQNNVHQLGHHFLMVWLLFRCFRSHSGGIVQSFSEVWGVLGPSWGQLGDPSETRSKKVAKSWFVDLSRYTPGEPILRHLFPPKPSHHGVPWNPGDTKISLLPCIC